MPYDLNVYDEAFYSNNQAEGLRHAEWFMPLLLKTFKFRSLVDVGCGTGHFLRWCEDRGMEVCGIEGSKAAMDLALVPQGTLERDLRRPFESFGIARKFDLCISIEVAEHIEAEYAANFVDTLCSLSDTIVITAAAPGQGGEHHVNEQPRDYWSKLFEQRGFIGAAGDEILLRIGAVTAIAAGHHVATWFIPNIRCFRRVYV